MDCIVAHKEIRDWAKPHFDCGNVPKFYIKSVEGERVLDPSLCVPIDKNCYPKSELCSWTAPSPGCFQVSCDAAYREVDGEVEASCGAVLRKDNGEVLAYTFGKSTTDRESVTHELFSAKWGLQLALAVRDEFGIKTLEVVLDNKEAASEIRNFESNLKKKGYRPEDGRNEAFVKGLWDIKNLIHDFCHRGFDYVVRIVDVHRERNFLADFLTRRNGDRVTRILRGEKLRDSEIEYFERRDKKTLKPFTRDYFENAYIRFYPDSYGFVKEKAKFFSKK